MVETESQAGIGTTLDGTDEVSDKEGRALTQNEINLARIIYKNSINYSDVKVFKKKFIAFQAGGVAMTPNGNLFMPGSIYKLDYTLAGFSYKSLFIHEMAHVWQFQNEVLELSDPVLAPGGDLLAPAYDAAMSLKYTKRGTTGDQEGEPMAFLYEYRLIQIEGQYIDLINYGHEQQASIIQDYYHLNYLHISADRSTETFPIGAYKATLANFLNNPSYAKGTDSNRQRLDPNWKANSGATQSENNSKTNPTDVNR